MINKSLSVCDREEAEREAGVSFGFNDKIIMKGLELLKG